LLAYLGFFRSVSRPQVCFSANVCGNFGGILPHLYSWEIKAPCPAKTLTTSLHLSFRVCAASSILDRFPMCFLVPAERTQSILRRGMNASFSLFFRFLNVQKDSSLIPSHFPQPPDGAAAPNRPLPFQDFFRSADVAFPCGGGDFSP